MAKEVRLWRVAPDETLTAVAATRLDLEARLETWIAADISILDPNLLLIGRQVLTAAGPLDLLCLDRQGDLVVIELKRDRTHREVAAQVLDYAACVADLSNDSVRSIAGQYLKAPLEDAFRLKFNAELPETLNGDHRMLIVGSDIDAASERITRYLSEKHGIDINAVTFEYFQLNDGSALLSRVFFIDPSAVADSVRDHGASKRQPNLTMEKLEELATDAGVLELFKYAVATLGPPLLQHHTTRSSLAFDASYAGGHRVVLSLIPGDSSAERGLHFQLYRTRFAERAGIPADGVRELMPGDCTEWSYVAGYGPEWQGFEGFMQNRADIDRVAAPLKVRVTPN